MIKTLYIKYVGLLIKIKKWFKTYFSSEFIKKKNTHTPEIKDNQSRFDR